MRRGVRGRAQGEKENTRTLGVLLSREGYRVGSTRYLRMSNEAVTVPCLVTPIRRIEMAEPTTSEKIRNHPVFLTVAICFGVATAIATVWLHFDSKADAVKEEKTALMQIQIDAGKRYESELKGLRKEFGALQVSSHALELKKVELEHKVSKVTNELAKLKASDWQGKYEEQMQLTKRLQENATRQAGRLADQQATLSRIQKQNWETRYKAEVIAHDSTRQELQTTKAIHGERVKSMEGAIGQLNSQLESRNKSSLSNTLSSFDKLLQEKRKCEEELSKLRNFVQERGRISSSLKEKNRILSAERDKLRRLVNSSSSKGTRTRVKSKEFPVDALSGVSISDVGPTIISICKSMKGSINPESFIRALKAASISDRLRVVVEFLNCSGLNVRHGIRAAKSDFGE